LPTESQENKTMQVSLSAPAFQAANCLERARLIFALDLAQFFKKHLLKEKHLNKRII
jgi:hypothetical protein